MVSQTEVNQEDDNRCTTHFPDGYVEYRANSYKVLQISKQGQRSGKMIKNKPLASAVGTQYKGFDIDYACRRIRELWPE